MSNGAPRQARFRRAGSALKNSSTKTYIYIGIDIRCWMHPCRPGEGGLHHQASSSFPLCRARVGRRFFATSTREVSRTWRLSVPGFKVDLPHHRPSGQRRGPSCRVSGGCPRGGATTAASKKWRESSGAGSSSGRKTKVDHAKMGRGGGFSPSARTLAGGSQRAQDRGEKKPEKANDE